MRRLPRLKRVDHRPDHRWRRRYLFAALGLRRPAAEHSEVEAAVLRRNATDARLLVEIGVAEGGSAFELRQVMAGDGTLVLVDPYPRRRIVPSMARIVARRLVGSVRRGHVRWIRATSAEAILGWTEPIDFLFIDGDHSYEGVRRDWEQWTRYVVPHGVVVLHDARTFLGGWVPPDSGPVRLLEKVVREGTWRVVDEADSTVALQRTTSVRLEADPDL